VVYRKLSRFFLVIILPLVLISYLSNIQPENIEVSVASTVDKVPLICNAVLIGADGKRVEYCINGSDIVKIPVGQYKFEVSTDGYAKMIVPLTIGPASHQHLDFGLEPHAQIFGVIRSSVTGKPIQEVEIQMLNGDASQSIRTDSDGVYSFTLQPGGYDLIIDHLGYKPYINRYFLQSGQKMVEGINLIPTDLSVISFSDFPSYSQKLVRKGHIAGFPQKHDATIKKNQDGSTIIKQTFNAGDSGGEFTIILRGEKAWWSDGSQYKPFSNEGYQAVKLMVKTSEQMLDYLHQCRFEDDAEVIIFGKEKVNGLMCDKVHIKHTGHNWMGKVSSDFDAYVMDEGKLKGIPTRFVGDISGWDELGHSFYLEFSVDVTDVGLVFDVPIVEDKPNP